MAPTRPRRPHLAHNLFRLILGSPLPSREMTAGAGPEGWTSYARLTQRVTRAQKAGLLGDRSVDDITFEWHAMCQGLAALEMCGGIDGAQADRVWADALVALLVGLGRPRGGLDAPADGAAGPA